LREGSLSGAARALRVAHPTIRRHLEELETAVGVKLFVRSPSGLVPTERALELLAPAETMEAAFEHLVRTASAEADSLAGVVRITASEVIGAEVLPPIITQLKTKHPGLVFELRLTDDVEDILRRDADIAVRMTRPVQSDLLVRKVAIVQVGLYARRQWLETHIAPADLDALAASGAVIGEDRRSLLLRGLAAAGVVLSRSDFAFRSDSALAQLGALRAGLGIGVCQVPLANRDPDLIRIMPNFRHDLEVWLVSHPSQHHAARMRVTLEALADGLAEYAAV
jgi:DNA-binding transcriptional LysR family regulator